jgi:replicative DNA helicase
VTDKLRGVVPCLLDSEASAIGAALCDNGLCEVLTTELSESDFYRAEHASIFRALKSLSDDGLEVTLASVKDRCHADLEAYVDLGRAITRGGLHTLINELKRVSGLRTVRDACLSAVAKGGTDAKLEEVLDELERSLYRVDRSGSQEASDGSDTMGTVVQNLLDRVAGNGPKVISSGLKELDRAILGLRPGKMMVIAARPGMGKTALADTLRRNVLEQGYGAIQFSLEMGAEELCERELAYRAKLNLRKILAAKEINAEELERVRGAVGAIVQGRWYIDDSTYSITGMRRRARIVAGRMARNGIKLGVVILDYIQLAGENGDGREQSVAAISRGCKLMAKELDCTVLALSQLNRACEARDDRRPMMSDLRESGSIEQDADIVGFVYREHMYDSAVPDSEAEFIIRKHRSGPTGTVRVHYNSKLVSFEDIKSEASLTDEVQDA